jgi:trehalose synthase-fused probable maltokinase
VAEVAPLDHAPLPGTPGILALFRVRYDDGGQETYQVPIVPGIGDTDFADAMDDAAFCLALAEHIRLGGSLAGRQGTFRFTPTEALAEILPEAPSRATRLRAEQTNTSVVFDRRAILKVFRKITPGPNPDFEITDFLTRRTDFRGIARLAGSIAYTGTEGDGTTLAVMQEFVPNQGDAWTATLDRLKEYYAAEPVFARTLAAADAEEVRSLGALTGRLHMALASAPGDPLFGPEPIEAADVAAWQGAMQAYLDRVMERLASAIETIPAPMREMARQILDLAPRLQGELEALQTLGEGVTKIRVHGDYHLGQVLKTRDGFVILDFEGEPARPLDERRARQCALKDVAGMLRSFDYAAHAGLFAAMEAAPGEAGLAEQLTPGAEHWLATVREAFLAGYLAETWEAGAPFLPRGREALLTTLRVFELDKAIYEIEYEINNRPAWLLIPLEGLRRAVAPAPRPRPAPRRGTGEPFAFVACHELREFVGLRAENERRLADLIEEVPLDSIYYHTHAFFLRHKFLAGAYPNDFATWTAIQVRDRVLGERLAMVDPREFATLQALREELVSVIDDHLRDLQIVPGVIYGEPFDFIQSRIVEIPTGTQVRTLQEFRDALLEVDVSAIYFHLVEARLRLGRGQNDFAAWLDRGLGLPELAARVRAVDPYAGSLEQTRARLIQLCEEALVEEARS